MSYIYRWRPEPHEPHAVEGFNDHTIRATCVDRVLEVEVGMGGNRRFIELRVVDIWQMAIRRDGVMCLLGLKVEQMVEQKFLYLDDRPDGDALQPAVDAIRAAKAAIDLLDDAHYGLLFKLREEVAEFFPEWIAFVAKALTAGEAR